MDPNESHPNPESSANAEQESVSATDHKTPARPSAAFAPRTNGPDVIDATDVVDVLPSGEAPLPAAADPQAASPAESSPAESSPAGSSTASSTGVCSNCGSPLNGPYCSECGQHDEDRIVPVWRMVAQFLAELVEADFRIFRTLPAFFFKPGALTEAYIRGQRRRYVRPIRLYVFASFLLFTVLAFESVDGLDQVEVSWSPSTAAVASSAQPSTAALQTAGIATQRQVMQLDSIAAQQGIDEATMQAARRTMGLEGLGPDQITAIQQTALEQAKADTASARATLLHVMNDSLGRPLEAPMESSINWREEAAQDLMNANLNIHVADSTTNAKMESMLRTKGARALRNPRAFVSSLVDKGPYLMFLLLPVFALLLKVVYARHGRLYAEHFVFTIHIHAFTFVALALSALTENVQFASLPLWLGLSPVVYTFIAMMRVYEQGVIKTTFKALFLFTLYSILLAFGFLALALATIFLF